MPPLNTPLPLKHKRAGYRPADQPYSEALRGKRSWDKERGFMRGSYPVCFMKNTEMSSKAGKEIPPNILETPFSRSK
jgi:hypothetical protein